MSPLLRVAEVQGMEGLMKKRNPTHFGMEEFFGAVTKLKTTFSKLIKAPAEQVAVIPAVSYGIANAAKNLNYKVGGELLCLGGQFPSNYYSWQEAAEDNNQKLKLIQGGTDPKSRVKVWNENILSAINPKTTAVCLGHVHWADGSLFDLRKISQACQDNDAYLVIDGTQSVGALPLYVDEIPVDVLVVGGYKWLLGHYGLGLAYYSDRFNDGIPIEHNWINKKDSENFQELVNYKDAYKSGAAKYSVGEQSNFIHVPILQAGLEQILEWGVDNIQAFCVNLHQLLIEELRNTPFRLAALGESSSHLMAIRVGEGMSMDRIKSVLLENNIHVSYRGDAIRISFYVYNTESEVIKMSKVLKGLL